MAKPLRLFCDGSRNHYEGGKAGWAYLIVDGDKILLAESGVCEGSSTCSEFMAIIQGMLSIPRGVRVHIVTDRQDVGDILSDPTVGKTGITRRKLLLMSYRKVLRQLAAPAEVTVGVIKSNSHAFHKLVDAMSRHACGLSPKRNRTRGLTTALSGV